MTSDELEARIVRYGDLIPCKTAFIDAHTPGSCLLYPSAAAAATP